MKGGRFANTYGKKDTDIDMRTARSKTVQSLERGEKQTIVTYGTSLTASSDWVCMFTDELEKCYPGPATVINTAENGMWAKWGVDNLQDRVIDRKPDAVFIEFAINDAYLPYETSVEDCRENLENILDRILKANAECEIILMTMNPPIEDHLKCRPNIEEYINVYQVVARERTMILVDQYTKWKKLLEEDKAIFDSYVPDGLHPARSGSENITVPTILEVLS